MNPTIMPEMPPANIGEAISFLPKPKYTKAEITINKTDTSFIRSKMLEGLCNLRNRSSFQGQCIHLYSFEPILILTIEKLIAVTCINKFCLLEKIGFKTKS